MSDGRETLPRLVPITRREPPSGYRAPVYDDAPDNTSVATLVADSLATEDAAEERRRAVAAVGKALTTYRWWGWTNIINNIRLWWQLRRQR